MRIASCFEGARFGAACVGACVGACMVACGLSAALLAGAPEAAIASEQAADGAAAVFSHPVPDAERKGSIAIHLVDGDTPIAGGTIELYRVGAVVEDDGDYAFALVDEFAGSGTALDETGFSDAQTAATLAAYAEAQGAVAGASQTVGGDGSALFLDLEQGVYLMVQSQPAAGYAAIDPFLVSIPMLKDGAYAYDVDASPKVSAPVPDAPSPIDPQPQEPQKPSDPTLPQTGQLNWPIPLLAVAGLVFLVLGWALRRGRSGGVAGCSAAHSASPADSAGTQS